MTSPSPTTHSACNRLARSRYNYFVQRGDRWLAYNARLGTIALLADDVVDLLRGDGPLDDIRSADELVTLGFLHHGDELNQVLAVFNAGRDNRSLHITIAPSLACNFACSYCYQNPYRNNRVMSQEVQEATLKFIAARVAEGRRYVMLEWYGGEPLLAKNLLLAMTPAVRDVVERANGTLERVSIITNGSLLDAGTAAELRAAGILEAQVSIDALKYVEGHKRGVFTADGSPSPILSNLLSATSHLKLSIRINVSAENKNDIPAIIEALNSYGFGRRYYLARVDDFADENSLQVRPDGSRESTCGEKSLPVVQQNRLLRASFAELEKGALRRPELLQQLVNKLEPKKHFCSATSGAMFVFDADGYISRCWESAGVKSEAIGNVLDSDGTPEGAAVDSKWASYSPFAYSACATCRVLPLCMGGCSYPRLFMDAKKPPCESIKQQIQFCVDEVGKRLKLPETTANHSSI